MTSQSTDALGNTVVRSTGQPGSTTPKAVLKILFEEFGVRLLLHEGGPSVFGQFLREKMIDELFLSIAPQIAGRSHLVNRPSIGGDELFLPETAPWLKLQNLKKGANLLFFHYKM